MVARRVLISGRNPRRHDGSPAVADRDTWSMTLLTPDLRAQVPIRLGQAHQQRLWRRLLNEEPARSWPELRRYLEIMLDSRAYVPGWLPPQDVLDWVHQRHDQEHADPLGSDPTPAFAMLDSVAGGLRELQRATDDRLRVRYQGAREGTFHNVLDFLSGEDELVNWFPALAAELQTRVGDLAAWPTDWSVRRARVRTLRRDIKPLLAATRRAARRELKGDHPAVVKAWRWVFGIRRR